VLNGKIWRRHGWDAISVLTPGSRIPGHGPGKITKVPRVLARTFANHSAATTQMEEFAARDLLFYPNETKQARERALDFGRRLVEFDREQGIATLPSYPDFSAVSMVSWAKLISARLATHPVLRGPVMVVTYPSRELRRSWWPAEIVEPISEFMGLAEGPTTTRELMPAFSKIAAAFGSTLETNKLAGRSDIAELLDVHGRILCRAGNRPDRRAAAMLATIDDEALGALKEAAG
jgi:hypothetical protein